MPDADEKALLRMTKALEAVEDELRGLRRWKADWEIRNGEWDWDDEPRGLAGDQVGGAG